VIHKRVTLATITGLTAALALTACGGAKSDTALNTAGGEQQVDMSQAQPEATGSQGAANDDGGGVSAAGGGYGSADNGSADGKVQAGVVTDVLRAKKTKTMGTVVVDREGRTLYRFDKDTNKPPATNCDGDCATAWPPVLTEEAPELVGVDKALIGKIKRADGSEQITLNGWALYRYAKDQKEGDWKGHGVKGVWWAITNKGGKAENSLPTAPPRDCVND
jgi:predicted lipoprotein with Yx(FWY)xxD motif